MVLESANGAWLDHHVDHESRLDDGALFGREWHAEVGGHFAFAEDADFFDGVDHTNEKIRAANVVVEKAQRIRKPYLCAE